nr:protein involved in de novo 2 [Quercus suber]
MKHMGDDGDVEILEKVDTILKQLRDKEGELEDLEALNQTLIVKERKSNDELQEARKELVNDLKDLASRAHIGVKRMGEHDSKPFHEAMKRKYNEEEAEDRASELCSLWEEYLKDPDWHPLKVITVDGNHQRASCNKNCNMFSVHHSEVRKLPCFDVKVPEACMEKWKEHYEQYRQDMTAPLRNGREGKMRLLMKS